MYSATVVALSRATGILFASAVAARKKIDDFSGGNQGSAIRQQRCFTPLPYSVLSVILGFSKPYPLRASSLRSSTANRMDNTPNAVNIIIGIV